MTISRMLAKNWWVVVLRGVIAIIFGLALFISPPAVIATMVLFFGAYAMVDGIMALITAFQTRGTKRWWLHLVEGILGIAAGIIVFMYPSFALNAAVFFVLYVVAFWAMVMGFLKIMHAIELRKEIEGEFWMAMVGVLSILFGVFLILAPGAGILALITVVAIYAIVVGIILLVLGFRLRSFNNQNPATTSTTQQHA